jgi:uncharacterized protein (DUF488 family)
VGERVIFSIGHSSQSTEAFLALLERHGIEVVADVRSRPYPRFASQHNEETLEAAVKAAGRRYVFLGRELGGGARGAG